MIFNVLASLVAAATLVSAQVNDSALVAELITAKNQVTKIEDVTVSLT